MIKLIINSIVVLIYSVLKYIPSSSNTPIGYGYTSNPLGHDTSIK